MRRLTTSPGHCGTNSGDAGPAEQAGQAGGQVTEVGAPPTSARSVISDAEQNPNADLSLFSGD
ncbi:hypothetical protein [Nonomuraea guangzhouensis]|uniref:Uncharacterized protein n=1 Tax=Nonomuraea guangzhouensis TaxID=1291555 RepID=A0ABW4GKY5_9ACTN|nr:hypothetical protein [Nonomuraea guangzhouensis]